MELPKNITQIGEANHRCKIYVEDYVISYMKQLNQVAQDKDMAVALYGVRKEENDVAYLFAYGACKLTFLQRETRHLSQAQQQEIERLRARYFGEYSFLGYRLLNGEMIEGMHICEQGICRYISGYAQFYEKNDSMLAYMLDAREEPQPEVVDRQKYEVVKKRQEERRIQHEDVKYPKAVPTGNHQKSNSSSSLRGMRVAVVAVFALLCVIGLTSMNGEGKLDDLQAMARQVMENSEEQASEDTNAATENMVAENQHEDALIAEDKLAEAILQENEAAVRVEQVSTPGVVVAPGEEAGTSEDMASSEGVEQTNDSEAVVQEVAQEEVVQEEAVVQEVAQEEVIQEEAAEPVSYIIKEGDTLIRISMEKYGSDTKVSEICALNQIDNPDDIKVGQKILLP